MLLSFILITLFVISISITVSIMLLLILVLLLLLLYCLLLKLMLLNSTTIGMGISILSSNHSLLFQQYPPIPRIWLFFFDFKISEIIFNVGFKNARDIFPNLLFRFPSVIIFSVAFPPDFEIFVSTYSFPTYNLLDFIHFFIVFIETVWNCISENMRLLATFVHDHVFRHILLSYISTYYHYL